MRHIKMFENFGGEESLKGEVAMIFSEFTDLGGELGIDVVDNRLYLSIVSKDTMAGFEGEEREAVAAAFDRMSDFCGNKGYHVITDGVDASYVELVEEEEMCPSCGSIDFSTDYRYERGRSNYECNDCGETGDDDDFVNRHLDITDEPGRDVESLIANVRLIAINANYSN